MNIKIDKCSKNARPINKLVDFVNRVDLKAIKKTFYKNYLTGYRSLTSAISLYLDG